MKNYADLCFVYSIVHRFAAKETSLDNWHGIGYSRRGETDLLVSFQQWEDPEIVPPESTGSGFNLN